MDSIRFSKWLRSVSASVLGEIEDLFFGASSPSKSIMFLLKRRVQFVKDFFVDGKFDGFDLTSVQVNLLVIHRISEEYGFFFPFPECLKIARELYPARLKYFKDIYDKYKLPLYSGQQIDVSVVQTWDNLCGGSMKTDKNDTEEFIATYSALVSMSDGQIIATPYALPYHTPFLSFNLNNLSHGNTDQTPLEWFHDLPDSEVILNGMSVNFVTALLLSFKQLDDWAPVINYSNSTNEVILYFSEVASKIIKKILKWKIIKSGIFTKVSYEESALNIGMLKAPSWKSMYSFLRYVNSIIHFPVVVPEGKAQCYSSMEGNLNLPMLKKAQDYFELFLVKGRLKGALAVTSYFNCTHAYVDKHPSVYPLSILNSVDEWIKSKSDYLPATRHNAQILVPYFYFCYMFDENPVLLRDHRFKVLGVE